MNEVKATNSARALYNKLINDDMYKGRTNIIITDSWLRSEVNIQGIQSSLIFNLLTNNTTSAQINCTEKRLGIPDKFVATMVSFMLMKAGASTAATQAEIAISRPRTYNNARIFTGANEAANLEALYNSDMKVTIDSTTFIQTLDLRRFYRAPVSEQGTAVSTQATTGVLNADGWDTSNYPFASLTPTLTFNGSGQNQVVVNLPNSTDLSGTSSTNFAILYFRGFLIQNANTK